MKYIDCKKKYHTINWYKKNNHTYGLSLIITCLISLRKQPKLTYKTLIF